MADEIDITPREEELLFNALLAERQVIMQIVIDVLDEHPESKPVCEAILQKIHARTNEELRAMLHVAHNIANLHPAPKKKQ